MKKILGMFIMIILLTGYSIPTNAQLEGESTLVVSGTGEVKAEPDIASFNVSVVTEGETASSALSSNSDGVRKVIDVLLMSGLSEKDIETSNVSVHPVYDTSDYNVRKITGYEATNSLNAKVKNINNLGGTIDSVVASGNFTVGGISFSLADSTKLQEEALKKAVNDAKRKAEVVAAQANKRITGIKNINVGSNAFIGFKSLEAFDAASAVPILPGEVTVSESVTIKYFID